MTLQTVFGGFCIPYPYLHSVMGVQNFTIDAVGEKAAYIVRAPKTGTISKVCFLMSVAVTDTTLDVRLEAVSATDGFPTGVLLNFGTTNNSNATQEVVAADDGKWFTVTLTGSVAVTKGDLFALVLEHTAGGDIRPGNYRSSGVNFPYVAILNTGSYVMSPARTPAMSVEYSDGSYDVIPGVVPVHLDDNDLFNSTDSPDEIGIKFKLPFPVRITGAWVNIDLDGNADLVLYNSASTAIETVAMDKDIRVSTGTSVHFVHFDGTQELAANTTYRLVIKPSTVDVSLKGIAVNSAAVMDAMFGGQDFHKTERTNGTGGWTDSVLKRPWIGLVCDGFDDGAGGAASILSGGFGL